MTQDRMRALLAPGGALIPLGFLFLNSVGSIFAFESLGILQKRKGKEFIKLSRGLVLHLP